MYYGIFDFGMGDASEAEIESGGLEEALSEMIYITLLDLKS